MSQVKITVDTDFLAEMTQITSECASVGLEVIDMNQMGFIVGRIDEYKVGRLNQVPGVESIEILTESPVLES